ncbi:hypothetical protein ID866_5578 [Astraeus odoratus]|nr:hypothetical protein ID866_5578 [Astraeus odoratus]
MNASLFNPFAITHPTSIQTSLVSGASFARFDPSGKLLAAGRPDGTGVIWDLDTRAPVRWCDGHVKGITAIDWSRNSRFILTASKDWNIIIWDLASSSDPPRRHTTIRFDAPVVTASFHPRNRWEDVPDRWSLVVTTSPAAYSHRGRFELDGEDDSEEKRSTVSFASTIASKAFESATPQHLFTSMPMQLMVPPIVKLIARHRIAGAGVIKGLEFAKGGRRLATNSSDRTIRQFTLPIYSPPPEPSTIEESNNFPVLETDLEPTHRFNDPISKVAWHAMSYSPDGEWLAGGAADPATHKIYIWDISNDGQFASALEGGREPLLHVHWHPHGPRLASTTNQGDILVWHCPTPERWGAFAGGFEEADENVWYEEGESEFDLEDETELALRKKLQEDEGVDIVGGIEDSGLLTTSNEVGLGDPDFEWADEEGELDHQNWKMKIIMVDGEDGY